MKFVRHVEGKTTLFVPQASVTVDPPPTSPVFFNPAAALNRDVTVALAAVGGGRTFCDSMAGVGGRGVRVAKEVEGVSSVTLVDFNEPALRAGERSARLNRVAGRCSFELSETNAFLASRFGRDQRFDYVDVDPFGTPIRHIQAALAATSDGGVLSLTATDTAVLCGVQEGTCRRRYGGSPLNNHFHHETGIRVLLGAVARLGAMLDIGAEPVAAHSTRHYLRVFVRVRAGASRADAALKGVGSVSWCHHCGEASSGVVPSPVCPRCGKKAKVAGPLWVGKVTEEETVRAAARAAQEKGLARAATMLGSLVGVDGFPPWSFSLERVCSALKVASAPEDRVYRALAQSGRRVARTPFEKTGLKTDAGYAEVVEAVRTAARSGI